MKKLTNKKGFTLAELLIVVAIIAVLVAVSIPVFGAQLNKAKFATDLANVRAAYAEAVTTAMSDNAYTDNGKLTVPEATIIAAPVNNATVTCAEGKITVKSPFDNVNSVEIVVDPDVVFAAATNP